MKFKGAQLLSPVLAGLLAGCVPNATTYYGPSVDGGRVVTRGHCVPLPTDVLFRVGTLPVRARVMEGYRSTYIAVRLGATSTPTGESRPAWRTFHFTADRFIVRDLERSADTTFDGLINSDTEQPVTIPATSSYWLEVHLPKPVPARFELVSPPIVIDGREYRFPTIRFARKLWVGISPFNC
jgi:hypothetical protein